MEGPYGLGAPAVAEDHRREVRGRQEAAERLGVEAVPLVAALPQPGIRAPNP